MKKVCQISNWGDTLRFQYLPLPHKKKFSDHPFQATIFEKFTFTTQTKFYPLLSNICRRWWQAADIWKKTCGKL
jgi:hypothetical protein